MGKTTTFRWLFILSDKVSTAVSAVGGQIWSRREGILFAGNTDRINEELKESEEEQQPVDKKIEEIGRKKGAEAEKIRGYNWGRYEK